MNANDYEIKRHIDKLDQVAITYEAKWGIGNLARYAGADMAQKWRAQNEKLNAAIIASDLNQVADLVEGTIRGYAALERGAIQGGYSAIAPDAWEIQHPESGRVYRLVKTNTEARVPAAKDTVTYSLEEIVRILETKQLVNVVKESFPGAKVTRAFDFKKGDSMPF
jgi:hypothetical protein